MRWVCSSTKCTGESWRPLCNCCEPAPLRSDLWTPARLDGRFTLRMAAVCFRTHRADIDAAVDVLTETARRLEADR